MTISRVSGQAGGTVVDSASSISRAFGSNVTAGNVVWFAATLSEAKTWVAGDLTKSAGTATLDTIKLIAQKSQDTGDGYSIASVIWCAKVTGSGSLTLQAGGASAGGYWLAASGEIASTVGFDTDPVETSNSNGTGTDSTSPATTGNGTSAGAAYFVGVLGIGCDYGPTLTVGGSWSDVYEAESIVHMVGSVGDRIVSSGTTDQGSWTISAPGGGEHQQGWAAVLGVLKETTSSDTFMGQACL